MTDEELEEIVNSEKSSYTLMEPDYSKVKFTIHCMANEMAKRGMARFWPIIKKGIKDMTYEEEQRLHGDKVIELLNEISGLKHSLINSNDFGIANMLGRCYETIKNLHVINLEAIRENRSMSDHCRTHFAGLAMQAIFARTSGMGRIDVLVKQAYDLADDMVDYGKQESKTKGREDGLGTTTAEDSN